MALSLSTGTRNAQASSFAALFDADAGAGTIKIYSGTKPVNADTAPGGGNVLLATFMLDIIAMTGPSPTGVMTIASLPKSATAVADGTATWWRGADQSGDTVTDGDCGTVGSGKEIELSTTTISTGLVINMVSGTFTQPA